MGDKLLPRGSNNPDYYIVGYNINESEALSKIIFDPSMDKSNSYLESVLSSMNINEVNCRFNKLVNDYNPASNTKEYDSSTYHEDLFNDIVATNPKIIIGLGSQIGALFLQKRFRYITTARGRLFDITIKDQSFKFLVTYNPTYLVKATNDAEELNKISEAIGFFMSDIEYCTKFVNGELVDISKKDLRFAKTYQEYKDYFDEYLKDVQMPSYDIESNAKDPRCDDFRIVGFSMAPDGNSGMYVIRKSLEYEMPEDDWQKCVDLAKEYIMSRTVLVHNIMYEKPATLNEWDIDINDFEDSLIKARLLLGGATGAGLKDQCILNLGYPEWDADLGRYMNYFGVLWNKLYPTSAGNHRWDFDILEQQGFHGLVRTYERMLRIMSKIEAIREERELTKDEEKLYKDNCIDERSKLCYEATQDMIVLINEYYPEDEVDHILDLIGKEVVNLITIKYSGILPYSSIPMNIITKYGAMDSVATKDLDAHLSARLTNESTDTVDLWHGYKTMKEHFRVGAYLEMNGLFWNDEVATENKEWLSSTAKESMINMLMSGYLDDMIYQRSLYLLNNEVRENMLDYVEEVLGPFEVQTSGIKLLSGDKPRRVTWKNLLWELPESFRESKREWVLSEAKRLIMDPEVHPTYADYKYLFNPASNKDTVVLNDILVTNEIQLGYVVSKLQEQVESEDFDINTIIPQDRPVYQVIINTKNYNREVKEYNSNPDNTDKKTPITQRQLFLKISNALESMTFSPNGKLLKLIEEAVKYKMSGASEPEILYLFSFYEAIGIDTEDESTWTKEFRFLYDFRMYKKCIKIISSYIDGDRVGRGTVWKVKRSDIDQNKVLPVRTEKYDWNKDKADDEEYLFQPTWKVCFGSGTKILMADGTEKSIDDIQVGDEVLSVDENIINDPNSDDNEWFYSDDRIIKTKVTKVFTRYAETIQIGWKDDDNLFRVTPNHPFLSTDRSWKSVSDIFASTDPSVGFVTYDPAWTVDSTDARELIKIDGYKNELVYNLETESHTYIAEGFIVHNCTAKTLRWQSAVHTLPAGRTVKGMYTSRYKGGVIAAPDYCLTGETKIKLLDGTSPCIEDLVHEFNNNPDKKFYTYAYDHESGEIRPALIKKAVRTKMVKQYCQVLLDNGEVIQCTDNHPFMMRDGSYKHAIDLLPGESLMPMRWRISSNHKILNGYEEIYHPSGYWEFTHHLVSGIYYNFRDANSKTQIYRHHKNENKLDNRPENIELKSASEHMSHHMKEFHADPNNKEKVSEWMKDAWSNEEYRKSHQESTSNQWKNPEYRNMMTEGASIRMRERMSSDNGKTQAHLHNSKYAKYIRLVIDQYGEFNEEYYEKVRNGSRGLPRYNNLINIVGSYDKCVELGQNYNHKVVEVRIINCEGEIPVYDLEIEKYHNFLIDLSDNSGVFVHNSQLEVRIIAGLSNCTPMLEAYKNGNDVHLMTACGIFNKPPEEITKVERRYSKMGCVVGSTKILMPNGCTPTVDQIYRGEYQCEDSNIISYDIENSKSVMDQIVGIEQTQLVSDTVRLYFGDDENFIECTPDHPMLLAVGTYKEAKECGGYAIETCYYKKSGNTMRIAKRDKNLSMVVTRIDEVHYDEPIPVYDLSVLSNHNYPIFIGNLNHEEYVGVYSHNTFRILYGSTPEGFASQFLDGDVQTARNIFDGFYKTYPQIKEWMDKRHREVEATGKVSCENVGYFINIDTNGPEGMEGAYRQGGNAPIQSFRGLSLIKGLDGKSYTIEEIANSDNKELWTYTCDPNTGEVIPVKGINAQCTGETMQWYKITLDNNKYFEVTPEHLCMLRSGEYVRADQLQVGQSLMPLYESSDTIFNNIFSDRMDDNKRFISYHKIYALYGKYPIDYSESDTSHDIHHIDHNHNNNNPDNLIMLSVSVHMSYHRLMDEFFDTLNYSKLDRAKNIILEYISDNYSEEVLKSVRSRLEVLVFDNLKEYSKLSMTKKNQIRSLYYKDWDHNQREAASNECTRRYEEYGSVLGSAYSTHEARSELNRKTYMANKERYDKILKESHNTESVKENHRRVAKEQRKDPEYIFKLCRKMICYYQENNIPFKTEEEWNSARRLYFKFSSCTSDYIKTLWDWSEFIKHCEEYLSTYNHKIVSIEVINLDSPEPKYDLEIPVYHNFALDCGVFVHNSQGSMVAGYVLAQLNNYFLENHLYTKTISFIHDSLEFDIHPKELFTVAPKILKEMNDIPNNQFGIFTEADVTIGTSMGMENEIKEMKFSEDGNEAWMTLEGFEDDLDEMYNHWKYNAQYQVVEYEDIGDKEAIYTRRRELFQEKLALGPFLGKTRYLMKRKFHIIIK